MRHLKSLREYIDALGEIGEIQHVNTEVDLKFQIGAISRLCYETGAPAPFFTKITGVNAGFRVLGAPAGVSSQPGLYLSRIAVSLANQWLAGIAVLAAISLRRLKRRKVGCARELRYTQTSASLS
jgi:UbiD family decarboxylase